MKYTLGIRYRILLGLVIVCGLVLGAGRDVPATHASFISVGITFANNGDLPLNRDGGQLDGGCWNPAPPANIPAHTTATWESESCGFGTGTEGNVLCRPYGAPAGVNANFYWDDPTLGDNSASDSAPAGCSSSHSGPPSSGDNVSVSFTMACSSSAGDGIADVWKLNGATFNNGSGPQFIDLPNMGATVNKPDVFLQIDWMQGNQYNQKLDPAAIKTLVNAFANSGYVSPTGSVGINLHVDQGSDSILNYAANTTWGLLSKAEVLPYQASLGTNTVDSSGNLNKYDWTAFNAIENGAGGFTSSGRVPIFHYVIAAHNIGTATNSGISTGSNIIISLGAFTNGVGSVNEQLGTLMHELGHNLGLGHGGGDTLNYKPNYFSVMNYAFQFSIFDYSHTALPSLNETALNEATGVGPAAAGVATTHYCAATKLNPAVRIAVANAGGFIDWSCKGDLSPESGTVAADINGDPAQPANTRGALTGYNDWAHLQLQGGNINFGAPFTPPLQTPIDDPTPEMERAVLLVDTTPPVTTASTSPPANAAGWNNTDVAVTLTATDDLSGVARTESNLDNAGWVAYTAPIVISTEAIHTLQYRSVDRAQNVETPHTLTVRIDKTPPNLAITPFTPNGKNGWFITAPAISTVSAADRTPGSGLASISCADSLGGLSVSGSGGSRVLPLSGDGIHLLTCTATDVAGNTSAPATATVKIDTTPPVVTCSVSPSSLWPPNGKFVPITATVGVSDGASGPAGFVLQALSSNEGSIADESQGWSLGTPSVSGALRAERDGNGSGRFYTLTYLGMDVAGLTTPCSTTVAVAHDQGH